MTTLYPETQHNHDISSWLFSVTFELGLRQRAAVHGHLKNGWTFTAGFYSHQGPSYMRKGLKRGDTCLSFKQYQTLMDDRACISSYSVHGGLCTQKAVDLRKVLLWKQNCSGFERDKMLIPGRMCSHLQEGKISELSKKDWRSWEVEHKPSSFGLQYLTT